MQVSIGQAMLLEFVAQLINKHFIDCSLLLLQDKFESTLGQRTNSILYATENIAKFTIDFWNGSHSVSLPSLPLAFRTHLSNLRQLNNQCMITLLFVNYLSSNFMSRVKDVIAPTYLPISRKDLDYYIFIAEPSMHEKLLHMEVFVSKIKFKVAIGVNQDKQIKLNTVDFFGGVNGSPKLLDLPVNKVADVKESIFPDFIWNLRGYTLQVTIPYARALLEVKPGHWTELKNAKRGSWKYLFEEYLMIKFNFTYRMFPSTGADGKIGAGGTGVQFANGTWIGLTGDLYYGRADLGLAAANTDKRVQYIGFTDTYFDMGCLTFVTGEPARLYSTLAIFWTFTVSTWILIVISTIGSMFFLFCVTNRLQKLDLESSFIKRNIQVILILAPFVEQDSTIMPISTPVRSYIAFWLFFTMIVTNFYRSKLVTLLAFPVFNTLPKTFEELAMSDFQVGFMKNGDSAFNTFSKSKDPVYVELIQRMEVIKGVNVECLEKVVRNERYACIAYDFDVVYLKQKNFSDVDARKLRNANARTYNIWLGITTEAHSIYRMNFGKIIGQTVPFHLEAIWDEMDMFANVRMPKLKWWKETNQTHKFLAHYEENHNELTAQNIKGVFYVFTYCIIVSLCTFFYEICCRCVARFCF